MFFIDTNIYLEWLLGRSKSKDCEKLLKLIEDNEFTAVSSRFSFYSIAIYLTRNKKNEELKKFLEYIFSLEKLLIVNTSVEDDLEIIKLMEETKLDFDDSLQYYIAKQLKCKALITFDKDFNKTDMRIFTPEK